ncbi:hypothetical protein ACIB24_01405 [Spongisporangium articulatum]|uniref:Uncharacterized protein n=1 Tax=Spongisporangium articulatum TaxID=3362603 RepID=A0ABW8AI85_9ACTN
MSDEAEGRMLGLLHVAMVFVQGDLERDLPDAPQLHVHVVEDEWRSGYPFVARIADDGEKWWGGDEPLYAQDADGALVAVAGAVQDLLAAVYRQVWPLCPTHAHGVHVRPAPGEHHGETLYGQPWIGPVAWWCRGDGGHMLAEIGRLGL